MQLKSSWIDHKILYRCVFYLIIWFNETNHTVSQLMFMCASRMPGTDQDMAGLWDKVLVLVELTLGAFYLQAWGWSLWSWDEYSRLISAPWKLWASEGDRWVVQEQEQHKVKKEALHLQRRGVHLRVGVEDMESFRRTNAEFKSHCFFIVVQSIDI